MYRIAIGVQCSWKKLQCEVTQHMSVVAGTRLAQEIHSRDQRCLQAWYAYVELLHCTVLCVFEWMAANNSFCIPTNDFYFSSIVPSLLHPTFVLSLYSPSPKPIMPFVASANVVNAFQVRTCRVRFISCGNQRQPSIIQPRCQGGRPCGVELAGEERGERVWAKVRHPPPSSSPLLPASSLSLYPRPTPSPSPQRMCVLFSAEVLALTHLVPPTSKQPASFACRLIKSSGSVHWP